MFSSAVATAADADADAPTKRFLAQSSHFEIYLYGRREILHRRLEVFCV